MINAEFVEKIADLARDAKTPAILAVPGESPLVTRIFNKAKNEYEKAVKDVDLADQFLSLETLVDFSASVRGMSDGRSASFWYSRSGVIWEPGRNDFATLSLTLSAPLRKLKEWSESPRKIKQDEAVRVLRVLFPNAATPSDLLSIVAGIEWKIDEAGGSKIKPGERSVGRKIEARLEGRDRLPDVVSFEVPVWENGGKLLSSISARIVCVLDADPQDQTFQFTPEAGAIEAAISGGEEELEARLRAQIDRAYGNIEEEAIVREKPPVFHGTPTKF